MGHLTTRAVPRPARPSSTGASRVGAEDLSITFEGDGRTRPAAGQALILVVERDPHVRRLERFFLEEAGFAVVFATDGLEALALAASQRPDIVITEVLVPSLDGLSLCRRLRAEPATASTLLVVLSVLEVGARAREAGADAVLSKPLDDEALIGTVSALLESRGLFDPALRRFP